MIDYAGAFSGTVASRLVQTPLPIVMQKVNLERFEMLVYSRRYEEAGRELVDGIEAISKGAEFSDHRLTSNTTIKLYSRYAAAIAALLADPGFQLSRKGFDLLSVKHDALSAVFEASVFDNSDHLVQLFGTVDPADPKKIHFVDVQTIVKLLLSYSLESELEIDYEAVFRAAPNLALPSFLGMLAHNVVCSPSAHLRRERLLTLGPLFEQVDVNDYMLAAISSAYMYCSYTTSPGKHEIKRSFNRMLHRYIETGITLPTISGKRALKTIPTIVVPVEWFTSTHAMYRCFGPSIERLRDKFHLILIGRSSEIDSISKSLFHEVIELSAGKLALASIVERIGSIAPDMIFYPSVGMAPWWTATASVRLAPIQIAAMGHPGTTNSDAIDYMIVEERNPGDPSTYSEIVVVRRGGLPMLMRHDASFPTSKIRERPAVLRIAVSAMAAKVTAPFLEVCRNITRQARRPVQFHFFPSSRGVRVLQISRQIRKWLPDAVIYPYAEYNEYLNNLNTCDVSLSTFPFGGSNSAVDTVMLAIPIVTLEGLEFHSQTESGIMRDAGLPQRLITHDTASFEREALWLIHNDDERVAIARRIPARHEMDKIFDSPGNASAEDYPRIFEWIFRNHEAIQQSGKRYWTVAEREKFLRKR